MIIGTAGHIDHGKTTLVRALTGVDTDRLQEEKARGISIELGYAYAFAPEAGVLGFVDVPGHERLVHTMVAGACGIDFALLTVAADDGVMPQTLEHLAIIELLEVSAGAVALTKIDRVTPARAQEAEAQVRAALAATPLADALIFPLDATDVDCPGVAALRQHLYELATRAPMHPDNGLFRLAVDRVFTLPGHGTVAAGTVFSGRVHSGDTLAVMPGNLSARVRSLHTHGRPADMGRAGERCALALSGVTKTDLARGDWLADPRALVSSTRLDVRLHLLPSSKMHLTAWSPVHVHVGTAHRVAHVVPLEQQRITAGDSARLQLVFDAPVCATSGERFIVRDAQGRHTIGGGRVLDPQPPARRRRTPERLAALTALERLVEGGGLEPLLAQARYGMTVAELVRACGRTAEELPMPPEALRIEASPECFVLLRERWQALREGALSALARFHQEVPDQAGPDAGRLRRMSFPDAPAALWRAVIAQLQQEQRLFARGAWLHLPEHHVTLSAADRVLADKLRPLILAGRFDPPWVRDLAATLHEREERVRAVLRKLVGHGDVYQVVRDLYYDRDSIAELAAILGACHREHGAVHAARFRDSVGLGRKRAIQILEFFDRVGHTRRIRDAHVLRDQSGWPAGQSAGTVNLPNQLS
ncbi:MAG TPA: selenocysteine-specific translation elongation factor [Steroidobacteraceae bacterium]|jgi:selenocysteine-specific elongation factor